MFKNKITIKLSIYFSVALLVFAIIIGSVFMLLFQNYSLNLNRNNLEDRANKIAKTIPNYLSDNKMGVRGFGMYLNVINEIEANNVWIIDNDLNLITGANQHLKHDYKYSDLPKNAEHVISEVLKGEAVFSEEFTSLLESQTLTVGVPIINEANQILGVVLLHSPIVGVNLAISQGLMILLASIMLALIIAIGLAIILSKRFTKPLVKMNETALKLIDNDYMAKTDVDQSDEIGQLAFTLDTLATRLNTASQESERLELMRSEFIANISHELKTPVTVMRGSLEALVDEVVSDKELIAQYHYQMLNEAKFLERLIQDLLELSKLQSLDFKIEKSKVLLNDVLDDVVRSAKNIAKYKNVEIIVNKEASNIEIMADYERVRQMLMITLDNAIKFSNKDAQVIITLNSNTLSIRDFGPGISESEIANIFNRFYKSRSEANKIGTGLGLAIAKGIADRHNIEVIVKSELAVGSTFTFKW